MRATVLMLIAGSVFAASCMDHTTPAAPPSATASPSSQMFFCGGETTRDKAQKFFTDLAKVLASGAEPEAFNRFVAPRFSVLRGSKYAYFDRDDFNAVTPRFISSKDWRRISEEGLDAVEDGGYRGCMMAHGKVWFDAYDDSGLLLKAINHDLAWDDEGAAP